MLSLRYSMVEAMRKATGFDYKYKCAPNIMYLLALTSFAESSVAG